MRIVSLCLLVSAIFLAGCANNSDPRVQMGDGVAEANLITNPIIAPFSKAISDLIGQGLVVESVIESTTPDGFYQVDITSHNNSYRTKKFHYRFEWLDANGALVTTKTSTWIPFSIAGNSTATIKGVAPRMQAKNFRIVTKDQF